MVVVALLSFLVASTYNAFLIGQSIWAKTEDTVGLEENLTRASDKIIPELRQSGHSASGVFQVSIDNNSGVNQSDILRFSIPVLCQPGAYPVDANGDTAHWGAPLTWGCNEPSCMDANNDCNTIEYKYIQYLLTTKNALVRRVLDRSQISIKEDLVAENIVDMQIEPNFNQRMLTLKLTAEKQSGKKTIKQSSETKIYLRNAH